MRKLTMLLTIQVNLSNLEAVLDAISTLVPSERIALYDPVPIPETPDNAEFEELANRIAVAIRPKATQPMRREALKKLARGNDTFWDQNGQADPALRNAMGAISKALRSIFGHDQAIRRLAVPRKTRMDDGSYQGTVYDVTPLGARVFELLRRDGFI